MSEDQKIIRSIIRADCPNCKEDIFVSFKMMPPVLDGLISKKDMVAAKEDFKEKLGEIKFKDKDEKESILAWINREDTLITKDDVDPTILQIAMKQEEDVVSKEDKVK